MKRARPHQPTEASRRMPRYIGFTITIIATTITIIATTITITIIAMTTISTSIFFLRRSKSVPKPFSSVSLSVPDKVKKGESWWLWWLVAGGFGGWS